MTSVVDITDSLATALWLAGRGFAVHPLDHPSLRRCAGIATREHNPATCTERGKHPCTKWSAYATTNPEVIVSWFAGKTRNVAVACKPSRLLVVDEDSPGGFSRFAASVGQPVPQTFTVRTGKGRHYYFAAPSDIELGNSTGAMKGYGVDVRGGAGHGGYVVAPGSLHASGVLYEPDQADAEVAVAPTWLVDALRPAAPSGDGVDWSQWEDKPRGLAAVPAVIRGPHHDSGGERHEVLMRYACSLRARDIPMAEAEQLMRVVWARCEQPPVSSTPCTWEDALGKLQDVYGRYQPNHPRPEVTVLTSVGGGDADAEGTDKPDVSTWAPVDLGPHLDGTHRPPEPTMLPRTDGISLVYPGLVHSLHGESESGKSLVAQAEAARHLVAGNDVLFIDFESDPASVTGRLLGFGVPPEVILERFVYVRPEVDPRQFAHELANWHGLLSRRFAIAVLDGVTDGLTVFGYQTKDNDGIATWMRAVPRNIARRTGAAVLLIDHVTKDSDTRGRFAIGGQAKLSGLDGAAYVVEVAEPLGRGRRGVVVLRVAKDRPGAIRGHCGLFRKTDRTQEAARITVDSTCPTTVVTVDPHRDAAAAAGSGPEMWRPTHLMDRASRAIEGDPGTSQSAVVRLLGAKKPYVVAALDVLISEGYVAVDEAASGSPHKHVSLRPYREASDPSSDAYQDQGPGTPGEADRTGSRPYTGDDGTRSLPGPGPGRDPVGPGGYLAPESDISCPDCGLDLAGPPADGCGCSDEHGLVA